MKAGIAMEKTKLSVKEPAEEMGISLTYIYEPVNKDNIGLKTKTEESFIITGGDSKIGKRQVTVGEGLHKP